MAPKEKRSFLPYSRGVDPEALRLGSLYLNPLDPEDGLESKRFEYQEEYVDSTFSPVSFELTKSQSRPSRIRGTYKAMDLERAER